jgi:hypothetical protein
MECGYLIKILCFNGGMIKKIFTLQPQKVSNNLNTKDHVRRGERSGYVPLGKLDIA